MKLVEKIVESLLDAGKYNPQVQVAPFCILWPDKRKEWESVITELQEHVAELFVFGEYQPEKRQGPGIWLRSVIAGYLDEYSIEKGRTPILYLPGVGVEDLKKAEVAQESLKPIIELQFRGAIWMQVDGKEWNPFDFLMSNEGGLNLEVSNDKATRNALHLALSRLLHVEVDELKNAHLDKHFFNSLVTGGDVVRDVLHWMNDEKSFKNKASSNEWQAFVQLCTSQFGLNPEEKSPVAAAEQLARREGAWKTVWDRFEEAPQHYPKVPKLIRKATPPEFDLFGNIETLGGWPQWNDHQEEKLREGLNSLHGKELKKVADKILELEQAHKPRRALIWSEMGEAPLAQALYHLSRMAEHTPQKLQHEDIASLQKYYATIGWQVDDAMLKALNVVSKQNDVDTISGVIKSIYQPWAQRVTRNFQELAAEKGYPFSSPKQLSNNRFEQGTCLLFVDGLRYDVAMNLKEKLDEQGFKTTSSTTWSALPSVTATSKPAHSPIAHIFDGDDPGNDFEVIVKETGQKLRSELFKKILHENGWQFLRLTETGDPSGFGWTELGDLDSTGHNSGWKVIKYLDAIYSDIVERVDNLLSVGWEKVQIITDHGWLLFPGGLPKIELASEQVENKRGRCAILKSAVPESEDRMCPWFWNSEYMFTFADGISNYIRGKEFAHGGLSLQECLLIQLNVTKEPQAEGTVRIKKVTWKGMRCNVKAEGVSEGYKADIRLYSAKPESSVVYSKNHFKPDHSASVVVEDDDLEGKSASVVILNSENNIVGEKEVRIGSDL